jgi:hypothetical protein
MGYLTGAPGLFGTEEGADADRQADEDGDREAAGAAPER